MDIVLTLLILILCIVLIRQFVGLETPVGIILLIVLVLLIFGWHGHGRLGWW